MNATLPWLDFAVLVVYLAGMVAMGVYLGRKSRTPDQFMKAGGAIPGWAVGISIFGTYVSSISFLALPGKAFAGDWNPFVFSLSIPLATLIAVRWFVPFYRRSGEVSAYHHLEARFGPWARTYAVVCYLLTQLARMGTIMYLLALALAPLTGWSLVTLILVTGLITVFYALIGGIEAVIWADVVQSFVLIGGALACAALLVFGMPRGPGQLFEIATHHHKFSLGSFAPTLAQPTFWVVLVYGIFINLQNFGIDQSYVQRYATARSEAEARKSVWLGALLYLPISALFLFIGTALFAYYTAQPELLAGAVDPRTRPDAVFPHFIHVGLPVGVTGLVIAAIFAAAQSTLASSINCSATLALCDIYRRYFRPQADARESMRVLHFATLGFGLAGTLVALAMIRVRTALDAWWELASILSGGMLGLFLLGLISKRAKNPAAATGVTLGVLVILWMSLSPKFTGPWASWRSPFHNFLVIVIGTLTILLVGLALSRFRRFSRLCWVWLLAALFPLPASSVLAADFIAGADYSHLVFFEQRGIVYREAGQPRDGLAILKDRGLTCARLRLFTSSAAQAAADPYNYINNLEYTLPLALRVKNAGLQFLLDFHYSDTWADPGKQTKPAAWTNLTFAQLKDQMRAYNSNTIAVLKAAGAMPDYVQVGNEIIGGLLWPDGRVGGSYDNPTQWSKLAQLLTNAIAGIRDAAGDQMPAILVHIDRGGDWGGTQWFFDRLLQQQVPFDMIGLSYYPFWHGNFDALSNCLHNAAVRYAKPIVLAETAFPWTGSGDINGLPPTPDGQVQFVTRLAQIVRNLPAGRGAGIIWWGAEYQRTPGYSLAGSDQRSFYDLGGNVLPVAAAVGSLVAPLRLNLQPSGPGSLLLSWPLSGAGASLFTSTSPLPSAAWVASTNLIQATGGAFATSVTVTTNANRFFRLKSN